MGVVIKRPASAFGRMPATPFESCGRNAAAAATSRSRPTWLLLAGPGHEIAIARRLASAIPPEVSLCGDDGVANGLNADHAVPEHERIDPVLDLDAVRRRLPLEEQDVAFKSKIWVGSSHAAWGMSLSSFTKPSRAPSLLCFTPSGVMNSASSA
jgi:hypothetical protein